MKEVNFRIIELQTNQVLLAKDFDNSDGYEPELHIIFFTEGVKIDLTNKFNSEESRNKHFDDFTDNDAQTLIDKFIKL